MYQKYHVWLELSFLKETPTKCITIKNYFQGGKSKSQNPDPVNRLKGTKVGHGPQTPALTQ